MDMRESSLNTNFSMHVLSNMGRRKFPDRSYSDVVRGYICVKDLVNGPA